MSVLPYECESIRERLPECADGSLVGRELARVEQHLAFCERCRKEVSDLRAVMGAMRAVSPDPVPDTLLPRVRLAVQQKVAAPGARLLWPRLAVPLAVLTALIAVSFALRPPKTPLGVSGEQARIAGEPSHPGPRVAKAPGTGGLARGGIAPEAERARVAASRVDRDEYALVPAPSPSEQPMQLAEGRQESARPAAEFAQPPATADQRIVTASPAPSREMKAAPPAASAAEPPRMGAGGAARGMGGANGRASVPGPRDRPGPYAKRIHWGRQGARGRAESPVAGSVAEAEAVAAPELFARASLVAGADGSIIALEVSTASPADSITLRLGGGPPRTFQWRGDEARRATVPLPMDRLGPGPAAVPLEVTSSTGKRDYVLFLPAMARLGQVAPTAPVARYQGAPLDSVLADLSKMTGLVILAEQPLDSEITGAIPKGSPGQSLRQLGAASGFDVQVQGDAVATLTHQR